MKERNKINILVVVIGWWVTVMCVFSIDLCKGVSMSDIKSPKRVPVSGAELQERLPYILVLSTLKIQ